MWKSEGLGDNFIMFISYFARELDNLGYLNCKGELSASHAKIIVYLMLHEGEEIYQKTIEEAFSLRASTVSRSLKTLEETGYVSRTVSNYDSRLKCLALTEKTANMRDSFGKALESLFEKMTSDIPSDELECFFGVLKKMKLNFAKMD